MWSHLEQLIDMYLAGDNLWVLKARQIGFTGLWTAVPVWLAKFFENAKSLLLSQGEEEAYDLISKCRFIDEHLPDFLQSARGADQRGLITFPASGGEIKALPSTERAGRSTDATFIFADELEFHPEAEKNFGALKPTIDAGGQMVGGSTADKTKLVSFFKSKYAEFKTSENTSFKTIFLPWQVRPGRTQGWFDTVTADLKDWQREQEYPESESDALGVLKSRRYFNIDMLNHMPTLDSIGFPPDFPDRWRNIIRIYKFPIVTHRYVCFTDPSEGKEDPHATVVRDHQTGEWVAVSSGYVTADECALIHDALCRFYRAFNSYELNARAGGIMSEKIDEMGTPNRCHFIDTNGTLQRKKGYGWYTGEKLKNDILTGLDDNITHGMEIIYDKSVKEEISNFFVPEGKKPQAPDGGHDDFIIAGGGCIQIDKYLPSSTGIKAFSFKYTES